MKGAYEPPQLSTLLIGINYIRIDRQHDSWFAVESLRPSYMDIEEMSDGGVSKIQPALPPQLNLPPRKSQLSLYPLITTCTSPFTSLLSSTGVKT